MRRQLLRLIEVSRLPNVTVQVFPFTGGGYSAYSRSFAIELALAPVDPESAPESHASRDSLSLLQHVMYAL